MEPGKHAAIAPAVVVRVAIVAWAWLSLANSADAGDVRKCRDREGRYSYVSGDCPAGTREIWVRQVQPEPVAEAARRNAEPKGRRQRSYRLSGAGSGHRTQDRKDKAGRACETAKRRRDEVRDRDWYTLTLDQLRALDERVARACR